jgi:Predicted N-acetylglucosaminyl transferase
MRKFFLSIFLVFAALSFTFASSSDLEEALGLLNDGQTDQAMEIVKEKLKNNPKSSDNHMAMGLIQLEKNDYAGAKESLEAALELDRKIVAAHYMLAMIYEKEGDVQKAIDKWQKIFKYSKNATLRSLADKHIRQLKGELK